MTLVSTQKDIPKEWSQARLGSFGIVLGGLSGKKKENFGSGKPYIPYKNVFLNSHLDTGFVDYVEIKEDEKQNRVKYGDYIFTVSSETPHEVGMSSVVDEEIGEMYLNSFCFIFRQSEDYLDPEFGGYLFRGNPFRVEITKHAKGSTRFNLSKSDFLDVNVIFPTDKKEQKKIAEILGSVDEEIQKTERIIGLSESLKRGLMKELFSKGIGHTKFKKTKAGEVPAEWDVELLDLVARRGSGHTPNKGHPDYWNGGIKWVSLSDSNKLDNRLIYKTNKEISLEGIKNSSAVLHKKNTVIVCRDAGIGKVAILGTDDMAVSQHFIAWECSEKLSYIYLYYWLQSKREELEQIATGTTIKTIGLSFFKKLEIPLPDIGEQNHIGDILWLIDDKILANKDLRTKLILLKKGLMQDLLSGEKRLIK